MSSRTIKTLASIAGITCISLAATNTFPAATSLLAWLGGLLKGWALLRSPGDVKA